MQLNYSKSKMSRIHNLLYYHYEFNKFDDETFILTTWNLIYPFIKLDNIKTDKCSQAMIKAFTNIVL